MISTKIADSAPPRSIEKAATHIAGLDEVLHGGLPAGSVSLVRGGPGTGKTILSLEFIYRGALRGEPGIFVCFEERAESLRRNAIALGWDIEALEAEGAFFILDAYPDRNAVLTGAFDLHGLFALVLGKAKQMGAKRLALDSLDVLTRRLEDAAGELDRFAGLHDVLTESGLTTLLSVKEFSGGNHTRLYEYLEFMVDCVLLLDQRVLGQVTTRRLRVLKYRGSGFGAYEYPYAIEEGGISLVPLSAAKLVHPVFKERVSSGLAVLDKLLGGGFKGASAILIAGESGAGKTSLACTFAAAACERGEKVLFASFEEAPETLTNHMLSAGIDLRPALASGKLEIRASLPESMGIEQHLLGLIKLFDSFAPDHVVIDAISAIRRMGTEQAAFDFITRISDVCKQRGVMCMLTNQLMDVSSAKDITGMGFSSLVDTALLLHNSDKGDHFERCLLITKSRGSSHSNRYHAFRITDKGIVIEE